MITNYYDDSLEKDETKQYKLIKKVSDNGTLFLYYKSIKIDKEEDIKNRIKNLEDVVESLTLTILDLLPEEEVSK
ncbi:hypothetical protein [Gemella morbillorum]